MKEQEIKELAHSVIVDLWGTDVANGSTLEKNLLKSFRKHLQEEVDDEALLQKHGWEVECDSPFEIRHTETGSFATLVAADLVLMALKAGWCDD